MTSARKSSRLALAIATGSFTIATAGVAFAQPAPAPWYGRYANLSLTLEGGVAGFTDEDVTDVTDVGGTWGVRAQFGVNSPIALEAAYLGSAQGIDALGLDNDAVLVGNGAEGAVRLNFVTTPGFVQPFAFAGVAWRHYDVTNTDTNFSDIEDQDDVLEVPAGVGLAYTVDRFTVDARGQFRFAFNNDLIPDSNAGEGRDLHRWGVSANLGYAF